MSFLGTLPTDGFTLMDCAMSGRLDETVSRNFIKDHAEVDPDEKIEVIIELEFIKFLEDNFECSGMCRDSPFFYTKPFSAGVPKNSCFPSLVSYFNERLLIYALFSIVCGLNCFWLFFLHTGFYH